MKKAFITGITGQDGSYLAELLLEKGYKVYGVTRRTSTQNFDRIQQIIHHPDVELVSGDLLDQHSLTVALKEIQPDEVYNLAAQSFVKTSWDQPVLTGEFTGLGVTRMLEATRFASPHSKFYQASSSEMFGKVQEVPQTEKTPFYPRSPYGVAKAYGHWITINYRESYNMFAVSVEAMWLMLQQEQPDDYVIATGETHSVKEFFELASKVAGISDWQSIYRHNPKYDRPAEVDLLIGDPAKAKQKLGWAPSISFEELVTIMVNAEIEEESKSLK